MKKRIIKKNHGFSSKKTKPIQSQYKERIQNKGHRTQKAVIGPVFSVFSASTDSSSGTPSGGVSRTAYYKRDCHGPSGLAMAFLAISYKQKNNYAKAVYSLKKRLKKNDYR